MCVCADRGCMCGFEDRRMGLHASMRVCLRVCGWKDGCVNGRMGVCMCIRV